MLITILIGGLIFMGLERIFPDQVLPQVKRWYSRAALFNAAQLAVVVITGLLWNDVFQAGSLYSIDDQGWPAAIAGFIGYLISTFFYYWWHRVRHQSNFLWLATHQLHHSPSRIETITAFYKHPLELVLNSLLSSLISYTLLGLSIEAAAWVTLFSALGEFVYHMNIRTPRWMGFFIQRPEMHRIHHERGVHQSNFADLPLWDMLFGTYRNPPSFDGPCGFDDARELGVGSMLLTHDVNSASAKSGSAA